MTHRIESIFEIWAQQNPHPRCELDYETDFELLIAVMLSAQATDHSVNQVTPALFKAAKTPQSMAALGELNLREMIKRIGLFRSKAKHIIQTCTILCSQHQGQVPQTRESLEALPGVGRKTANVVLNTAFGLPTIAVDTHVARVSQRLQFSKSKTPLSIEQSLYRCIPEQYLQHAHHWMILHGRYTCKARKPNCSQCCIRHHCPYPHKTT